MAVRKEIDLIRNCKSDQLSLDSGWSEENVAIPNEKLLEKSAIDALPTPMAIFTEAVSSCELASPSPYGHPELRRGLAIQLNDYEYASYVSHCFQTLLRDEISLEHQQTVIDWLVRYAYYLGSPRFNHDKIYADLPQANLDRNSSFQQAYKNFVSKILEKVTTFSSCLNDGSTGTIKVAVLYPGLGGGGHKAPAQAICNYLEKLNIEVMLFDVDEYQQPYDPKIGGYTRGEIYSEVFQKEGDIDKAVKLWVEADQIQPDEDRRFISDLKRDLAAFCPTHMLAVAHHMPLFTSLAYHLDTRMIYVHTDNSFNGHLTSIAEAQIAIGWPLVSFTTLNPWEQFLYPVKYLQDRSSYLLTRQLVPLSFPVRESFQPVTMDEMNAIRTELKIPEEATVCKLAMGKSGSRQEIMNIIHALQKEQEMLKEPLVVYVITGTNTLLKKELDAYFSSQKGLSNLLTFRVEGFLAEAEMAKIDQASDIWITKPGGSTIAEAIKMQKMVLAYHVETHNWEWPNLEYALNLGIARRYDQWQEILPQIAATEEAYAQLDLTMLPKVNWTDQLQKIVTTWTNVQNFVYQAGKEFETGLTPEELTQICTYIEETLPQKVAQGEFYLYKDETGLARTIEYDPVTGNTYIHLKQHNVTAIGTGKIKKVTRSLLYDPQNPRLVVSLVASDTPSDSIIDTEKSFMREYELFKEIQGAKWLVTALTLSSHVKKANGKTKYEIVQELYSGGSLESVLQKSSLTREEKEKIAVSMLRSLQELHERGYAHRDLHPGNFLLDNEKNVFLADFGQVHKMTDDNRVSGAASRFYRSPDGFFRANFNREELIQEELFALGCSLYKLEFAKSVPWMSADFFNADTKAFSQEEKEDFRANFRKACFSAIGEIHNPTKMQEVIFSLLDPDPKKRKSLSDCLELLLQV